MHRSCECPESGPQPPPRLLPPGIPGPTTALRYLSWTATPLPPHAIQPARPQPPKLGLPWARGTPSPQGARPGGLCPLLGGLEKGGLGWGGPRILRRHEHVELDERRGDDAHLGIQGVEAQVDAAQGGHGGQLLHGHVCQGERDRLGGWSQAGREEGGCIAQCTWAQCPAPGPV